MAFFLSNFVIVISNKETSIEAFNIEEWQHSRRAFIRTVLLGTVAIQLPFIQSCNSTNEVHIEGNAIFPEFEMNVIFKLQNTLFPADGNGPSAADLNAHNYFVNYLSMPSISQSDYDYFVNGCQSFISYSEENFTLFRKLTDLSQKQWNKLVSQVQQDAGQRKWLSSMVFIIFEALLLDPIYGGNTNEMGWEWLNHASGQPRITENYKHPHYLEAIIANESI